MTLIGFDSNSSNRLRFYILLYLLIEHITKQQEKVVSLSYLIKKLCQLLENRI